MYSEDIIEKGEYKGDIILRNSKNKDKSFPQRREKWLNRIESEEIKKSLQSIKVVFVTFKVLKKFVFKCRHS